MVDLVPNRADTIDFLEPPRLTPDQAENFQVLNRWTWQLSQEIIRRVNLLVENQNVILDRLDLMYTLLEVIEPIADPSTATNEEIATKVNEILAALNTTAPEEGS